MNKYILKAILMLFMITVFSAVNGCSDDSDDTQDTIENNGICTKWGAPKSEVKNYMKNYEMEVMEPGFLCYKGKDDVRTISYQFQDEALVASLALIPKESTSLERVKSSFSKYEYLGEKNGMDIYVSEAANTMVTIGKRIKNGTSYYAVGYVALGTDL